jgi:hypothetical protein
MNIIFNIILIYFFIFICLIIGIPGTNKENIIQNKIVLFIGVFFIQLFLIMFSKYSNKCRITIKKIANHSIFNGLISIIAYSIYIDLITMNSTKYLMTDILKSKYKRSGLLSAIITLSIFTINIFKKIIGSEPYKCYKYKDNNY